MRANWARAAEGLRVERELALDGYARIVADLGRGADRATLTTEAGVVARETEARGVPELRPYLDVATRHAADSRDRGLPPRERMREEVLAAGRGMQPPAAQAAPPPAPPPAAARASALPPAAAPRSATGGDAARDRGARPPAGHGAAASRLGRATGAAAAAPARDGDPEPPAAARPSQAAQSPRGRRPSHRPHPSPSAKGRASASSRRSSAADLRRASTRVSRPGSADHSSSERDGGPASTPPSITMVCPVMKDPSGGGEEHRRARDLVRLADALQRRVLGALLVDARVLPQRAGEVGADEAGRDALARTFRGPHSTARLRTSCMSAALEIA
jgi:hypothetical protein